MILLQFPNVLLQFDHLLWTFFFFYYREAGRFERAEPACLDLRAPEHEDLVVLQIRVIDREVLLGEIDQVAPSRTRLDAEVDGVRQRRILVFQLRSAVRFRQLFDRGKLRLADGRRSSEDRERLDEHVESWVLPLHADGMGHRSEGLGVVELGARAAVGALLEKEEADARLQGQLRAARWERQEIVEMIEEIRAIVPS